MTHERGASAVEYCLLLGLIALLAIGAVRTIGPEVSDLLTHPGDTVTTTTVTVLGETLTRDDDCEGRDHAHQGCK
jgi:Flp pilus assembly pilin Flp